MKTYLLSAAGVVFLSVVVSLIVPDGKMHKMVTFAMRLICIFVLISPLVSLFKGEVADTGTVGDIDYTFVEQIYSVHQSEQLEKLLLENLSAKTDCVVKVLYDGEDFKVDSVEVAVEENFELSDKIYEYLKWMGYINITVYAKGT